MSHILGIRSATLKVSSAPHRLLSLLSAAPNKRTRPQTPPQSLVSGFRSASTLTLSRRLPPSPRPPPAARSRPLCLDRNISLPVRQWPRYAVSFSSAQAKKSAATTTTRPSIGVQQTHRRTLSTQSTPVRSSSPLSSFTLSSLTEPGSIRRLLRHGVVSGLGLGAVVTVMGVVWSPTFRDQFTIYTVAIFRSVATFITGCLCMADYKILHLRYVSEGYTSDKYKAERKIVHQRCADRLLGLCRLNTGIYTKAGQHVASLTFVVPPEYTNTLSVLQDRAPFKSMKEVEQVFMDEFGGAKPLDLFKEFDPTPMAAASLAQVHRAVTKDGRKAAVKVQYNDVRRLFRTDMGTMEALSNLVSFLFPEFELGWIVKEFRDNLTAEFDFTHEARNGEATKERFMHRREFYVPEIYWDLSTAKILTMEFIDGVKVNDLDGLERIGVQPSWVRRTLLEVFAEMVFLHGVLHCDPHAGNILIRRDKFTDKPQFVLLDHGLYRELDENFRYNYCHLWRALILNDQKLLDKASDNLGIRSNYVGFIPLILIQRPPSSTQKIGEGMTEQQKTEMRSSLKGVTMADIFEFLETLPRDMLLVFRTINLTRGIHQQLGGENVERFHVNAMYATQGVWTETRQEQRDRYLERECRHAWKHTRGAQGFFGSLRAWWHGKQDAKDDNSSEATQAAGKQLGLGFKNRWYLFGGAPTLARSFHYLVDTFSMQWRLLVVETFLKVWLWWVGKDVAKIMT